MPAILIRCPDDDRPAKGDWSVGGRVGGVVVFEPGREVSDAVLRSVDAERLPVCGGNVGNAAVLGRPMAPAGSPGSIGIDGAGDSELDSPNRVGRGVVVDLSGSRVVSEQVERVVCGGYGLRAVPR